MSSGIGRIEPMHLVISTLPVFGPLLGVSNLWPIVSCCTPSPFARTEQQSKDLEKRVKNLEEMKQKLTEELGESDKALKIAQERIADYKSPMGEIESKLRQHEREYLEALNQCKLEEEELTKVLDEVNKLSLKINKLLSKPHNVIISDSERQILSRFFIKIDEKNQIDNKENEAISSAEEKERNSLTLKKYLDEAIGVIKKLDGAKEKVKESQKKVERTFTQFLEAGPKIEEWASFAQKLFVATMESIKSSAEIKHKIEQNQTLDAQIRLESNKINEERSKLPLEARKFYLYSISALVSSLLTLALIVSMVALEILSFSLGFKLSLVAIGFTIAYATAVQLTKPRRIRSGSPT